MIDTAVHSVKTFSSFLQFVNKKMVLSAFHVTAVEMLNFLATPDVCLPCTILAFLDVLLNAWHAQWWEPFFFNNKLPTVMQQNQHLTHCFSRELNYHDRCNIGHHPCLQNVPTLRERWHSEVLEFVTFVHATAPLFPPGNSKNVSARKEQMRHHNVPLTDIVVHTARHFDKISITQWWTEQGTEN